MGRRFQLPPFVREYPGLWFTFAIYFVALIACLVAMGNAVSAAIVAAFTVACAAALVTLTRRYQILRLSKIGEIRGEIADCKPAGTSYGKKRKGLIWLLGLVVVLSLFSVVAVIVDFVQDEPTNKSQMRRVATLCLCLLTNTASVGSIAFLTLRSRQPNPWLITDRGLFSFADLAIGEAAQLRRRNNPNSRIVESYRWDQIASYYWNQREETQVLHLRVTTPGFGIPQLVSFDLRSSPDSERQRIDESFRTFVPKRAERGLIAESPTPSHAAAGVA